MVSADGESFAATGAGAGLMAVGAAGAAVGEVAFGATLWLEQARAKKKRLIQTNLKRMDPSYRDAGGVVDENICCLSALNGESEPVEDQWPGFLIRSLVKTNLTCYFSMLAFG
jgi:hypothetical protein